MRPLLLIFSGAPATGKSTLSRLVAQRFEAIYLRLDTLEQPIIAAYGDDIADIGYRAAYGVARENLLLGRSVVADCVNDVNITRDAWREVASRLDVSAIEIEILCSDLDERRRRAETRSSDIPGFTPATWEKIRARCSEPWRRDHIMIDTAGRSIEDCLAELMAKLPSVVVGPG